MKATPKTTTTTTVWQVRWPGSRWRRTCKTRAEARRVVKADAAAKADWYLAITKPFILKITTQKV